VSPGCSLIFVGVDVGVGVGVSSHIGYNRSTKELATEND